LEIHAVTLLKHPIIMLSAGTGEQTYLQINIDQIELKIKVLEDESRLITMQ
jgi:hypothetical protein